MTRNKDYVKVFIFERTISGHLRRVDCYPQRFRFYLFEEDRFLCWFDFWLDNAVSLRFDFCSVTRDIEPGGRVEVELGLVVSHCRVQQFRWHPVFFGFTWPYTWLPDQLAIYLVNQWLLGSLTLTGSVVQLIGDITPDLQQFPMCSCNISLTFCCLRSQIYNYSCWCLCHY